MSRERVSTSSGQIHASRRTPRLKKSGRSNVSQNLDRWSSGTSHFSQSAKMHWRELSNSSRFHLQGEYQRSDGSQVVVSSSSSLRVQTSVVDAPHRLFAREEAANATLHAHDLVLEVLVALLVKATAPLRLEAPEATHDASVLIVLDKASRVELAGYNASRASVSVQSKPRVQNERKRPE